MAGPYGSPATIQRGVRADRLHPGTPRSRDDGGHRVLFGSVAVHLACRSLHDRESDLALAGGAWCCWSRGESRRVGAGPPVSDRSVSFVRHRRGRVRVVPKAAAVVLLKRLPDALRDGDRILAVVRGTAANQDGRTVNIATPSMTRRSRSTRRRWRRRGWSPNSRHG